MRVLITGGVGRLGLKACRAFIGDGFQVRLFDLQSKQNVKRMKELGGKVEILSGDITQPDSVRQALQGVDAIVHLAGLLPPVTDEKPELAFKVNVGGTRVLLDAIRENGRRGPLGFTSSIVVFGGPPNATEPLS